MLKSVIRPGLEVFSSILAVKSKAFRLSGADLTC